WAGGSHSFSYCMFAPSGESMGCATANLSFDGQGVRGFSTLPGIGAVVVRMAGVAPPNSSSVYSWFPLVGNTPPHVVIYALPGASYRPPDQDMDPSRTMTTSIVCASPSGPDV